MARTMDHFVEHMHEAPVIVLACVKIHRPQMLGVGGSVWPAVQNLLLAARALGYGGVITGFHGPREAQLRELLAPASARVGRDRGDDPARPSAGPPRPCAPAPAARARLRRRVGSASASWASDPPGTRFTQAGPPVGVIPAGSASEERGVVPGTDAPIEHGQWATAWACRGSASCRAATASPRRSRAPRSRW